MFDLSTSNVGHVITTSALAQMEIMWLDVFGRFLWLDVFGRFSEFRGKIRECVHRNITLVEILTGARSRPSFLFLGRKKMWKSGVRIVAVLARMGDGFAIFHVWNVMLNSESTFLHFVTLFANWSWEDVKQHFLIFDVKPNILCLSWMPWKVLVDAFRLQIPTRARPSYRRKVCILFIGIRMIINLIQLNTVWSIDDAVYRCQGCGFRTDDYINWCSQAAIVLKGLSKNIQAI